MIDAKKLEDRWVHSHEEDTPDFLVYRPSGFAFPPSRGRDAFELHADGTATDAPIAAADGNSSRGARWELSPDGAVLLKDSHGKSLRKVQVEEAAGGRLLVKR